MHCTHKHKPCNASCNACHKQSGTFIHSDYTQKVLLQQVLLQQVLLQQLLLLRADQCA